MRKLFFMSLVIALATSCNDESERLACEKATKEYNDAAEAFRIFKQLPAPPSVCNPCDAQQVYQVEFTKLRNAVTIAEQKKKNACN